MTKATLKSLWSPIGADITTPEELQRFKTRAIYVRAFAALLVFTCLLSVVWIIGLYGAEPVVTMLALDLLVALGLWLNIRRMHRVSSLMIVGIFIALGIHTVIRGHMGTSLVFSSVAVILAAHVYGVSALWATAVLEIVAYIVLGWLRPPPSAADWIGTIIPVTGGLVGIALIESYVIHATRNTLSLMQANTKALEDEIVERYRAEEALRNSERRYRDVIEQASDVILTINADGYYTFANAAAIRLSGYSLEEFRTKTYTELVVPDYQRLVKQHFLRQYTMRAPLTYGEYPFMTKSGSIIWLGYNVSLLVEGEVVRGFHVIGRDITERKRFEDAIRRSEEHYRRLFELANDAIIIFDPGTEEIYDVNRYACHLYGFNRDEFIGKSLKSITLNVSRGEEELRHLLTLGSERQFESEHRRKDGSTMSVLINSSVVDFEGRKAILSINRDITERKLSEEALRHAQKMESLGILAGGIAHDFNNLLQAILGQSALALTKLDKDHKAYGNIQKSEKAAERAAELTQQLLAYSGRGKFQIHPIRLNDLLRENMHLLEVSVPKSAQLKLELSDEIWEVEADPGQMQQLVMNLILNAGEAIGDRRGAIVLRTRMEDVAVGPNAWSVRTGVPLTPGRYVIMEVEDTGSGMTRETMDRIFDPFFTTKFTGRGLGLAAVLGIIRGHKGGLMVESFERKGTLFRVALPAMAPTSHGQPASASEDKRRLHGTVLVIDDEAMVREVVVDILESEGVSVLTAENGERGVELLRSHRRDVALVLLDLSMPGISGGETFRRLKQVDASVKVVVSSGFSETEAMEQFKGQDVAGFIKKPYRGSSLVEALKQFMS